MILIFIEQPINVATISDDPCSQNFDCTLSFKTRSKIRSNIDDNGNSFSDCKTNCVSAFDIIPRQRKTKTHVNAEDCDCYCAMYHDPCPEESPSGMHIIGPIIALI